MVKNLPFADTFAREFFSAMLFIHRCRCRRMDEACCHPYADVRGMAIKEEGQVMMMRHVWIRGIMGLIWLVAAVVSGMSGSFEMAVLYVALSGVFLYSAYATWKKEKDDKGGK